MSKTINTFVITMTMIIHGYLAPKDKTRVTIPAISECPACRNKFRPTKLLFFPREIWHPFRTYDFFHGFACSRCGYLVTRNQIIKQDDQTTVRTA